MSEILQLILSYALGAIFIIAVATVLIMLRDTPFYGGIRFAKTNEDIPKIQDKLKCLEARISQLEKSKVPIDQIYHLASPDNPDKTVKTNNVLGLAKRAGARVLTASTVYGDPEVHPQSETDCGGHVNPDEVKRVAETLSYAYAKQDNVEVREARIFNTFGPRKRMNDGHVVSSFIHQALQDEPITVSLMDGINKTFRKELKKSMSSDVIS